MSKEKIEKAIRAYVKLRDDITKLDNEHKERISPMKENLAKLQTFLLRESQALGVDSFKTPAGTAYRKLDVSYTVADRNALFSFIKETGDLSLLKAAANKQAVEEYIKEHDELPPGVDRYARYKINVNRPRAK